MNTPISPTDLESELESLLAQIRFSDEIGDTRSGCHFLVVAKPWTIEDDPDHFRVQVRVHPLDGEARALMPCRVVVLGDLPVIPPGPTNGRGDVFFRRLPRGSYEAYLAEVKVPPPRPREAEAGQEPVEPHYAKATPHLTAHFAPAGEPGGRFEPLRFRLSERPIEVILNRSPDGSGHLTFRTTDEAEAGKDITWTLEDESGRIAFERAGGHWEAEARLTMSADAAQAAIPRLSVAPLDENHS